jgi:hypothetical protein
LRPLLPCIAGLLSLRTAAACGHGAADVRSISAQLGPCGGVLVLTAFGNRDPALGIALAVVLIIAVSVIALAQATLQGIYSAALYRFATGDPATGGFDRRLLENAFRAKS